MSGIVVIGEETRVQGFGLAGAGVEVATDPDDVRAAWDGLDPDVALVVLTPNAASALGERLATSKRLTVVMPA